MLYPEISVILLLCHVFKGAALESTFASGALPVCSQPPDGVITWNISKPCLLSCSEPTCRFQYDAIRVAPSGVLLVDEAKQYIQIRVRLFILEGQFLAGTRGSPFRGRLDVVLTGSSSDQENPAVQKEHLSHGVDDMLYSKVLLARSGSTVRLHGLPKTPWIKLAGTVKKGSSVLPLVEMPVGWRVGDRLVVPSTSAQQTDESEVVTLVAANASKNGTQPFLVIKEQLQHDHYADAKDIRLNGEVGVLSHNVRIIGEVNDTQHEACLKSLAGDYGKLHDMTLIRQQCYGGHTAFLWNSSVQLANVEMTRVGQATRIARYPIHWHLAGDQSNANSYVSNNSIWESYQRCVTIHGTWGAVVEGNVCYYITGHAIYLEDSVEFNNTFENNLVVKVRRGPMVCTDFEVGPSAFWITNPNNTFVGNLAVDTIIGYWIISGGNASAEDGPEYLSVDYWDQSATGYSSQRAGAVFNPSRQHFSELPSVPRWVLGQQQARTPLKNFSNNGCRSSFRGVHIDGFITASIPGELGSQKHGPEELHVFNSSDDGTCNYFPKSNWSEGSATGLHVYAPVLFSFDAEGNAYNFSAAYSVIDKLHISRCDSTWWSRAARLNVTNSVFAWNWVGMTNHDPGSHFCPHDGNTSNPGLANHITGSLFIGYGDAVMNELLCANVHEHEVTGAEPPAGIRQYDGAFWLFDCRWTNMTTVACPSPNASGNVTVEHSLPYSLVAARQFDCNEKFQIHLYQSWPLGASPADAHGPWSWALQNGTLPAQNVVSLSGMTACGFGTGGVVDMTGTLDPLHPGPAMGIYPSASHIRNPGELALHSAEELESSGYEFASLPSTSKARVSSAGWYYSTMRHPNYAHICSYCNYSSGFGCPDKPPSGTLAHQGFANSILV